MGHSTIAIADTPETSFSELVAELGADPADHRHLGAESPGGDGLVGALAADELGDAVRPLLDVDMIYTDVGSYRESGAGLLNREIEGRSGWTAMATPTIEAGTSFSLSDDYRLDTFARVGVTVSSRDDWKSEVGLAAAPSGVNGFTTELPMDRVYGRVGLGFQLTSLEHNVQLRAEYNGDFSSHTTRHGGMLRVSLGF